jgi:hypothetical protein
MLYPCFSGRFWLPVTGDQSEVAPFPGSSAFNAGFGEELPHTREVCFFLIDLGE